MLKLQDGANVALVHLSDTWISLKDIRKYKNERTGLTGLTLVCEGLNVLWSELEPWGREWTRIGHEYQSNDANCANFPGNYIRGVRMQYDIEEPEVKNVRPPGLKAFWRGTSLGTMIFNFALACTRDFSESVRFENILRYVPEIPGGMVQSNIGQPKVLFQFVGRVKPVQAFNVDSGHFLRQLTNIINKDLLVFIQLSNVTKYEKISGSD